MSFSGKLEINIDRDLILYRFPVELIGVVPPVVYRIHSGLGKHRRAVNNSHIAYLSIFHDHRSQNHGALQSQSAGLCRINRRNPVHKLTAGDALRHRNKGSGQ